MIFALHARRKPGGLMYSINERNRNVSKTDNETKTVLLGENTENGKRASELVAWVSDNLPSGRDNDPYYALYQKVLEMLNDCDVSRGYAHLAASLRGKSFTPERIENITAAQRRRRLREAGGCGD